MAKSWTKYFNRGLAKYLGWGMGIITLAWAVLQLPLFLSLNNLVTDLLQGQTAVRDEIVIVAIDDSSLNQIGAWPWDRNIFAKALSNLDKANPKVVAIDVLFLESRSGDEALIRFLNKTKTPIILGSKLVDGDVIQSIFPKALSGYVNFQSDVDGKIRRSQVLSPLSSGCQYSLGLMTFLSFIDFDPGRLDCNSKLAIRNTEYPEAANHSLAFNYSLEDFNQVSFADLYNNKFDTSAFENKIVMIGSTALDLRSNLNDNFTDIFGRSIAGIEIHSSIVNSFLQNSFLSEPNPWWLTLAVLVGSFALLLVYRWIKRDVGDAVIYGLAVLANVGIGLVVYNLNWLWPILPITIILTVGFIYALAHKYLTRNQENRYIKQAFGRYLSSKLLNKLLQNPEQLQLGGEVKDMTVLFSDIRGFTSISETMSSTDLVDMLNNYLDYMSNIILSNDGTIDKYIGDAIMAIWNAPLDDPDHATKAIKAAMAMKTQVREFVKSNPNYPEINIGIGLNSGPMTVGNLGGSARFDYTVIGDNVNLGARLEGLTKKYDATVICTQDTASQYHGDEFIFRLLDEVTVKGKTQSVKIMQPLAKTPENLKKVDQYAKAFSAYQQGNFNAAKQALQSILNSDKPSRKLLDRVEGLITNPPKTWTGIWNWDEK